MEKKYTDATFKYTPITPEDEDCCITGAYIARELGEQPQTIYDWANAFGEYLTIKKINGRWSYTKKSLEEFKFIQTLRKEKGWSWRIIEEHISKKGFEFAEYDGGLINPKDPMGYEALAVQISMKNQEMMKVFFSQLMEQLDKRDEELLKKVGEIVSDSTASVVEFEGLNTRDEIKKSTNKILEEVSNNIEEKLSKNQDDTLKTLETQNKILKEELRETNTKFDKLIDKTEEYHKKDIETVENLRKILETRTEENKQEKGFLSRLFNKK